MNTFTKLKQQARESATWRGHDMKRFTVRDARGATSECKVCGMGVQVLVCPQANEIAIGGRAVALNCPSSAQWGPLAALEDRATITKAEHLCLLQQRDELLAALKAVFGKRKWLA